MESNTLVTAQAAMETTIRWLEQIVIGLNLCPFAKGIHVHQQIRFAVFLQADPESLLESLKTEIAGLIAADVGVIETTLLIHPNALVDFLDYNDFLRVADQLLEEMELDGILQIASFHPAYQFANTRFEDVSNYTNRSPFPILHLLREDSVTRAVESMEAPDEIFVRNMETLQRLGPKHVQRLFSPFR